MQRYGGGTPTDMERLGRNAIHLPKGQTALQQKGLGPPSILRRIGNSCGWMLFDQHGDGPSALQVLIANGVQPLGGPTGVQ